MSSSTFTKFVNLRNPINSPATALFYICDGPFQGPSQGKSGPSKGNQVSSLKGSITNIKQSCGWTINWIT